MSGLRLNISKTVFVPPIGTDLQRLRTEIAELVPQWGQVGLKMCAPYLGSLLGPGKGGDAWKAFLKKFRSRVDVWRLVGVGLRTTAQAYRVYVASVLLFVAQLEDMPDEVLAEDDRALLRLAPGPGNWTCAQVLRQLCQGWRRHTSAPKRGQPVRGPRACP